MPPGYRRREEGRKKGEEGKGSFSQTKLSLRFKPLGPSQTCVGQREEMQLEMQTEQKPMASIQRVIRGHGEETDPIHVCASSSSDVSIRGPVCLPLIVQFGHHPNAVMGPGSHGEMQSFNLSENVNTLLSVD